MVTHYLKLSTALAIDYYDYYIKTDAYVLSYSTKCTY